MNFIKSAIFFLIFTISMLNGDSKIEISADSFKANQEKKISSFSGNVVIKRDGDLLSAQKLDIYFDDENKPLRYEAIGGVKIVFELEKKRYDGVAKSALYDVKKDLYILDGEVDIKDSDGNRVEGQKVVLYRIDGKLEVDGALNKPVKFIFTIKSDK